VSVTYFILQLVLSSSSNFEDTMILDLGLDTESRSQARFGVAVRDSGLQTWSGPKSGYGSESGWESWKKFGPESDPHPVFGPGRGQSQG